MGLRFPPSGSQLDVSVTCVAVNTVSDKQGGRDLSWLLVLEGFSPSVRESMAEQLSSGDRDLC